MIFALDDRKKISQIIGAFQASLKIKNECYLHLDSSGLIILENPYSFNVRAIMQEQFFSTYFTESSFSRLKVGYQEVFNKNNYNDQQTAQKNGQLTNAFIEIQPQDIMKSLKILITHIRLLSLQFGYRINETGKQKRLELQLNISAILNNGAYFEDTQSIKNLSVPKEISEVISNIKNMIPIFNNSLQNSQPSQKKINILKFNKQISKEFKTYNQNEGMDLEFSKEDLKIIPILNHSDVTLSKQQFSEYNFDELCQEFGCIKHILIDAKFFLPMHLLMKKVKIIRRIYNLKFNSESNLFIDQQRDDKKTLIYLFSSDGNSVFSISQSTGLITMQDEDIRASELDINELNNINNIIQEGSNNKILDSPQTKQNIEIKIKVTSPLGILQEDSLLYSKKEINYGDLKKTVLNLAQQMDNDNQNNIIRLQKLAEEQSLLQTSFPTGESLQNVRRRIFQQK